MSFSHLGSEKCSPRFKTWIFLYIFDLWSHSTYYALIKTYETNFKKINNSAVRIQVDHGLLSAEFVATARGNG